MLSFADDLRVYLYREPIDFRCGINTLAALVEDSMRLDPLARAVYAFHNRKCDRIKLLLYERTGFWLLLRRLEQDRFVEHVRIFVGEAVEQQVIRVPA
ncbi:IS66 family insertion sequence element accessory protein TnpB [Burkholderia cenocepacia]|uniref:IS66 family insertion sequence element accessory protein TnpB n=2 Tax=Burkholderia cenocepacia TaxID=95486 RepID=UPI000AFA32C3|nr:IS66 family insertion sequence element accessory protein TnpB [Burkholderia cenocepacia]MBR8394818.1 IS66 family insertion sequence element accessory protein TnpB [Burkholderia cenocepacia]MBR8473605.1 IS66 family insertion sequence element accessory protein TnpB [Burkholderia cenocepacia]MBR8493513.1 IS66 family insertion sequence element accessory protein TnpB [Burkholderia cenocepacia]MDO5923426.1 IS66 family insertion sequence element accessory protein TnpB [Burkholderia cenocepacia]